MRSASALLFAANLVYATSYVATRVVLDDLPPAFLALVRLVVGAAILVPIARALEKPVRAPARGDAWRIVWMGVVGFAGAFALSHWGLARSTATNAALLIIVEPLSIMALSPLCSASACAGARRPAAPSPSWAPSSSCSTACRGSRSRWRRTGAATSYSCWPASPTGPTR